MKKIAVIVTLLSSLLVLGCSSSTPEPSASVQQKKEVPRLTVVSSAKPVDVLPAFTTFTWNDEYNQILSAVDHPQKEQVKTYIRNELITYLKTKGYRYQADPSKADVVIGFLFALENDRADSSIRSKFGLLPGVKKNQVTASYYAKGTLLLTVLDPSLKKVYWRTAVQGFVDFEKDRKEMNGARMRYILPIILSGFPQAGR